jgi:hypothetical protein
MDLRQQEEKEPRQRALLQNAAQWSQFLAESQGGADDKIRQLFHLGGINAREAPACAPPDE